MNGVCEERLSGAGLAKKDHRHVGFRREQRETEAARHCRVAGRQIFDFQLGRRQFQEQVIASSPRSTDGSARMRTGLRCARLR